MINPDIPAYSGWSPRSMRSGGGSTETGPQREAKRSRLGNSKQRAIYKSAKGHLHNEYSALCKRADKINNR